MCNPEQPDRPIEVNNLDGTKWFVSDGGAVLVPADALVLEGDVEWTYEVIRIGEDSLQAAMICHFDEYPDGHKYRFVIERLE